MEITRGTLEFLGLNNVLKTYDRWSKTRDNITINFKQDRIILKSKPDNKQHLTKSFFI